jgi:hypothetical protein
MLSFRGFGGVLNGVERPLTMTSQEEVGEQESLRNSASSPYSTELARGTVEKR